MEYLLLPFFQETSACTSLVRCHAKVDSREPRVVGLLRALPQNLISRRSSRFPVSKMTATAAAPSEPREKLTFAAREGAIGRRLGGAMTCSFLGTREGDLPIVKRWIISIENY